MGSVIIGIHINKGRSLYYYNLEYETVVLAVTGQGNGSRAEAALKRKKNTVTLLGKIPSK